MSKRFVTAGTAYAKALRPQGTLFIQGTGSQGWGGGRGHGMMDSGWGQTGRALSTTKRLEILF